MLLKSRPLLHLEIGDYSELKNVFLICMQGNLPQEDELVYVSNAIFNTE
jgi:hypothetical protein